jgi:hypothetical protein
MKGNYLGWMATVIFVASGVVRGENIYIAQTAQGSDNGTNAATAHSAAWFNTAGNLGNGTGKISAGDTAHLCGIITSTLTILGSGTAGNPIVILFENNAKISNATWPNNTCILSATGRNYIVIDGGVNGIIEATDNGSQSNWVPAGDHTYANTLFGINLSGSDNIEIKNMTVQNLYHRVPVSNDSIGDAYGIVTSDCDQVSIHDNKVIEARRHIGLYTSSGSHNVGAAIYNNTLDRGASFLEFGTSSNIGNYDSIAIYNNTIGNGYVWDGIWNSGGNHFHGGGIHVYCGNEPYAIKTPKIYNNTIGAGGMGNCFTSFIFLEGHVHAPLIYNNVLKVTRPAATPANGFIYLKETTDSALVCNNTMISYNQTGMGICLGSGMGQKLFNNIFYNTGHGIRLVGGSITESSYNLFDSVATWSVPSVCYNLACWQNQSPNYDNVGSFEALNLMLDTNYRPQNGSPVINRGKDLSALFSTDKDGTLRPQGAGWEIGAYEYVSTKIADSGLRIAEAKTKQVNPILMTHNNITSSKLLYSELYDVSGKRIRPAEISHGGVYLIRGPGASGFTKLVILQYSRF